MTAALAVLVVGAWAAVQATAGRLPAILLSYRAGVLGVDAPTVTPGPAPSVPATSWVWPIRGTVSSEFGPRGGRNHDGIDIAAAPGTIIGAATSGRVVFAGAKGGYGLCVDVEHAGGLLTRYAHMRKITARVGQTVAPGSPLGEVGSTGNSTGPHLHFEVHVGGRPHNPRKVIGGAP